MNLCLISLLLLLALRLSYCNMTKLEKMSEKVLKERFNTMYGVPSKLFQNDSFEHPRNDKDSLAEISRNWIKYYECLSHLTQKLTTSLHLPNAILRVYSGSVVRFSCNLCISPAEKDQIKWLYAPSVNNLSFTIMKEKDTAVQDIDMTIYYTRFEDSGIYQCQLGNSSGGLVVLEVIDKDPYVVVKSKSSNGPHPSPPTRISGDAIIFTSWSPWSECSSCNVIGRRRRYGICHVGLIYFDNLKFQAIEESTQNETQSLLDNKTTDLFHAFPNGIPCRSNILPRSIQNIPLLQSRRNEIMIGLCKVPCKTNILEIRSQSGEILEKVNNSAGIYSLCQNKPQQPPEIARDILFVSPGEEVTIICPGTILRDIPVTWRKGTKFLSARDMVRTRDGKAYLNARDHIIFKFIEYTDTAVYSCWQDNILAGVVKLVVRSNPETVYKRRFALVTTIIIMTMLLKLTIRYQHYRRRQMIYR